MATKPFPTPLLITGGCLCGAIRYGADFPPPHDFAVACQTCQCTRCRRTTGTLFLSFHSVAKSALPFLPCTGARETEPTNTPASAGRTSTWPSGESTRSSISARSAGDEGGGGPARTRDEGFGRALAGARSHMWCTNEIAGLTDGMLRGKKLARDKQDGVVLYED